MACYDSMCTSPTGLIRQFLLLSRTYVDGLRFLGHESLYLTPSLKSTTDSYFDSQVLVLRFGKEYISFYPQLTPNVNTVFELVTIANPSYLVALSAII